MSIPTSFNPLGTLGASPLPPGFRPLAYVETTSAGPKPDNLPWPGLRFQAFNQETDTLIIDGGATGNKIPIFNYANGSSRFIGSLTYYDLIYAGNGNYTASSLTMPCEYGKIYHIVSEPNKVSIDDTIKILKFVSMQPDASTWGRGALLARVEHVGADGVSVETVVAAERIADSAHGLVSLTTGVFLEV